MGCKRTYLRKVQLERSIHKRILFVKNCCEIFLKKKINNSNAIYKVSRLLGFDYFLKTFTYKMPRLNAKLLQQNHQIEVCRLSS